MNDRAVLMVLAGAAITASAACVEPDAALPDEGAHDEVETETQAILPGNPPCEYITCGRNTRSVGNGFVDEIRFDGSLNAAAQRFVSWRTASGVAIEPVLGNRGLRGRIGSRYLLQPALAGSVFTLFDHRYGQYVHLRIDEAAEKTLPNDVTVWTYRMSKQRLPQMRWTPLCSLFTHTTSEEARYALVGTRERVDIADKVVTSQSLATEAITIGCPNTATGKMLSLGALTTTAAGGEAPTTAEMTATLRALTLSPTGDASYTRAGTGVLFSVRRTGVDNNGEQLSGGVEGYWDEDGAICFAAVRINGDEVWNDTRIPSCDGVDTSGALVKTDLFFGVYPEYPPPPRSPGGFGTR